MKPKILILCISFLFVLTNFAFADSQPKQILYIVSAPGSFTTTTFTSVNNNRLGSVRGYGKSIVSKKFQFTEDDFNELLLLINLPEFNQYIFEPTDKDNMADPEFHNISTNFDGKKTNMRLPKTEENISIKKLIQLIDKISNAGS